MRKKFSLSTNIYRFVSKRDIVADSHIKLDPDY